MRAMGFEPISLSAQAPKTFVYTSFRHARNVQLEAEIFEVFLVQGEKIIRVLRTRIRRELHQWTEIALDAFELLQVLLLRFNEA